jgi:hypothetical protein
MEAEKRLRRLLLQLGPKGEIVIEAAQEIEDPLRRIVYMRKGVDYLRGLVKNTTKYLRPRVPVGEFISNPDYVGPGTSLWPEVSKAIIELCEGDYIESVLTGGIGTAKTTVALYALMYGLYELLNMADPHKELFLDSASEISMVFQSITGGTAKSIDYQRFRNMIERSPYFAKYHPHDKDLESVLQFERNIIVKPVHSLSTAAIGENVIGGMIDEVNFMQIIEKSSRATDQGVYDQASENYRAIARRRESRFMVKGNLPGMLCLVSSKRYPGQFTDKKQEEAKTNPKIYVYDKRVWDVKPPETFTGQWFDLFVGDLTRKPKFLTPEEAESVPEDDRHLVDKIPLEYKTQFEDDIYAALRDIAGVSTAALHPFIANLQAINDSFGKVTSLLSREDCDFVETSVTFNPKKFINTQFPRFVHVDLALTGDSAGIACGYVPQFKKMERAEGVIEAMPYVVYDFVLEVKPPRNDEINYEKIRTLISVLRKNGLPIKWVTFDSYQSTDSKQLLRQLGFVTGDASMDKTTIPYDVFKTAILDGRLLAPRHEKAQSEIRALERDQKKNKIDHPSTGSKDCADAMAGVAYGITRRTEVWVQHGFTPGQIPASIRSLAKKQMQQEEEAKV